MFSEKEGFQFFNVSLESNFCFISEKKVPVNGTKHI